MKGEGEGDEEVERKESKENFPLEIGKLGISHHL